MSAESEARIEAARRQGLTTVDLSYQRLSSLPDSLRELTGVAVLLLSGNQLVALPSWLREFTGLVRLDLSLNRLAELPEWLGDLSNLVELAGERNQLRSLPVSVGRLASLVRLDLYANRIETLPSTIGGARRLQWLDLAGNHLREIPDSVSTLTDLRHLDLKNNQLTALPDGLGALQRIERLDVSGNQLAALPLSLADLPAQALQIANNPLGPDVLAAARSGPDRLAAQLLLLKEQGPIRREAKLVLAGEGGVGKSSLLAALRGDPWVDERLSTHGIEIKQLRLRPGADGDVTLNAWDFGGQPDYRPTHQLFFSALAVYVVVWDPRRGHETSRVEDWIEMIKHRAGVGARVLVVATHASAPDRHPAIVDENGLRHRFGQMIAGFHYVDSRSGEGITQLRDALVAVAAAIPHVNQRYRPGWDGLRELILKEGRPYLTFTEYARLAHQHGISEADARTLAMNSHALGHWIYYGDEPGLSDLVVFKADWLSTAISMVIEDARIRASGGLFAHRTLTQIWNNHAQIPSMRYPDEVHAAFLYLMTKFDISYQVTLADLRDEPTSLIAQLVASSRPALEPSWDSYGRDLPEASMACEVVDDTGLPVPLTGLMYQLIVRFHRYSLGRRNHRESVHWQDGMVVDNDLHGRALILAERNRVAVTVRAAYPQFLLDRIVQDIRDHIDGFWQGLRVQVRVPCGDACAIGQPGAGSFDMDVLLRTRVRVDEVVCERCHQEQQIDQLLLGVPQVNRDLDGVIRGPSAAVIAELERIGAIVSAGFGHVLEAVHHGNDVADRIHDVLTHEVLSAISQAEERLRDQLLAMESEARDGPRLYTVEPLRSTPLAVRIRVVVWCEHSMLPVRVLNGKNGATGTYDFDVPRAWLVRARPWLKAASILLRSVLPVGLAGIEHAVDSVGRWSQIVEQLRSAEELLTKVGTAAENIQKAGEGVELRADARALPDVPIDKNDALVRTLRSLVAQRDPSLAGLKRVRDRDRYLWVHPRFESFYNPPLPTIPT